MNALTIEDLLPNEWGPFSFEPYEPSASYSALMDCIIYLQEDLSYRADRIDQFLTILWHPHEDRVVGIKVKGIRFLFDSLQSIIKNTIDKDLSDDNSIPLVGAIELALKMRVGTILSERLQQDHAKNMTDLTKAYD